MSELCCPIFSSCNQCKYDPTLVRKRKAEVERDVSDTLQNPLVESELERLFSTTELCSDISCTCFQCEYDPTFVRNKKKAKQTENLELNCTQCNYKSTTKRCLKKHIESFHESVRFQCYLCDYKARRKDCLQQHIQCIHENKKYECSQCDYKATNKSNLQRHIKYIHKNINSKHK